MARLGELLVSVGVVTRAQCELALRAQVVCGARLGTNLVELGLADLDTVTRVLGVQHGLPGALAHHFEAPDLELQQRLAPETAQRLLCVPLLHVFGARHGIVIATAAPPSPSDLDEIADELLTSPDQLIVAIAAEMRIRYQLERAYGLPRPARFLRVRGSVSLPPPLPELPARLARPAARTPVVELDELGVGRCEPGPSPSRDERRRYLAPSAPVPAVPSRMARGSREILPLGLAGTSSDAADADTLLAEALGEVQKAADRDHLASAVLAVIERFAPTCAAAALLLVRGDLAVGWRTFSRAGGAVAELVMPLANNSLLTQSMRRKTTLRATATELDTTDRILLDRLSGSERELVVVPIVIGSQAPALIACATMPTRALTALEDCARSASMAFDRLLRGARLS